MSGRTNAGMIASIAALVVSLALCAWAVFGAVDLDSEDLVRVSDSGARAGGEARVDPGMPVPGGAPPHVAEAAPVGIRTSEEPVQDRAIGAQTGAELLTLAVENDPFSPERMPPRTPDLLPSERVTVVEDVGPREASAAPAFRVVGSVGGGRSGAALVQVGSDAPRLIVLGETVLGYRLSAVDAESATLTGPNGPFRLAVMEPLAGGAPSAADQAEALLGGAFRVQIDRSQALDAIQQRFQNQPQGGGGAAGGRAGRGGGRGGG